MSIAVAGKGSIPTTRDAPMGSPPGLVAQAAAPTIAAQAPLRSVRAATPSPRSDWPAAVAARNGVVPVAVVNRFTIDDIRPAWSAYDSTPPWVRRIGDLSNDRTDPHQR